jgi:alpha-glucosidase
MRAGYTGSTRYCPSFWNGDQLVNWSPHQGFPTVIPGSLSMGFTGAGYVHSDLGGYTTILWLKRSRELVLRWAEQAAFTQTMRSHEGNRPYVGVKLHEDAAILEQLAKMTGVFAALKPYHESLSDEYQEKGLPPIRHPWIHYPGDRHLLKDNLQYQYMYGADLMVAPVIGPGRKSRRLRLPDDRWIHLWTGSEYSGGPVRVAAPVGRPAVFYRKGSAWTGLFEELKTC